MGWRLGHGIGPKISYEERKRQDALSHAPVGSGGELADTGDHDEAKKHLYPPRDTKVPTFRRKDDKYGLGYEPGLGLSEMLNEEMNVGDGTKRKQGPNISGSYTLDTLILNVLTISTAGFGLGALNDADEDDIDVYDRGNVQTSRRLAYDAEEDDDHSMMGSKPKSMRVRC